MGWLLLLLSAGSEVLGVVGLKKYSQKKTLKSGLIYGFGFGISFLLFYIALQYLQLSIAYAVWIGFGTAGAVLINMIYFGESRSKGRIASVGLIIVAVIGLKILS